MQYNLETIAESFLEKFDKKMIANQKAVFSQIQTIFDFLGDRLPRDQRRDLELRILDILNDGDKNLSAVFTATLNKVVREIREIIKD